MILVDSVLLQVSQTDLTLLQFVALALPAIAILMQAIIRYHESHEEGRSSVFLEISLLVISFTFLSIAAVLIGVNIYLSVDSGQIQNALAFILAAFILLVPAAPVTVLRTTTLPEIYKSRRSAIVSGLKSFLIMAAIFLSIFPLLAVFFELIPVNLPSIIASVLFIAYTFVLTVFRNYYEYRKSRKEIESWESEVNSILNEITDQTSSIPDEVNSEAVNYGHQIREFRNLKNKLGDLIEAAPNGVESDELSDLERILSRLSEIIEKLEDSNQARQEITETKSEIDELDDYIMKLKEKLDSLREDKEGIETRIESSEEGSEDELIAQTRSIETNIEEITARLDENQETKKKLEMTLNTLFGNINAIHEEIVILCEDIENDVDGWRAEYHTENQNSSGVLPTGGIFK